MITILPDDNSNPVLLPDSALFGSDADSISKAMTLLNNPPIYWVEGLKTYKGNMVLLQTEYKNLVKNRDKNTYIKILALTLNLDRFCK